MSEEYKVTEIKNLDRIEKLVHWHEPCYGEYWTWGNFKLMGCPKCGKVSTLKHKVITDGEKITLEPSVICPFCKAHYFVKQNKIEVIQ